jgi:hypothetical protein
MDPMQVLNDMRRALTPEFGGGGKIFPRIAEFFAHGRAAEIPLNSANKRIFGDYISNVLDVPDMGALDVFKSRQNREAIFGDLKIIAAAMVRDLEAAGGAGVADLANDFNVAMSPAAAPHTLRALDDWNNARFSRVTAIVGQSVTEEAHTTAAMAASLASLRRDGREVHRMRCMDEMSASAGPFVGIEPTHSAAAGVPPRPGFEHLAHGLGLAHRMAAGRHGYLELGAERRRVNRGDRHKTPAVVFSRKFGRFGADAARSIRPLDHLFPGKLTAAEREEDKRLVATIMSRIADGAVWDELEAQLVPAHAERIREIVETAWVCAADGGISTTCVPALVYAQSIGVINAQTEGDPDARAAQLGGMPWEVFVAVVVAFLEPARLAIREAVEARRTLVHRAADAGAAPLMAPGHDYILCPVTTAEAESLKLRFKNRDMAKEKAREAAAGDADAGGGDSAGAGTSRQRAGKRAGGRRK